MIALLMATLWHPALATTCRTELSQDLNCNGVDASAELSVDLSDPVCAAGLDPAGNPYTSADAYYDYGLWSCDLPVSDYDVDLDGFSAGTFSFSSEDGVDLGTVVLACDN